MAHIAPACRPPMCLRLVKGVEDVSDETLRGKYTCNNARFRV